jgi:hypothetical protein
MAFMPNGVKGSAGVIKRESKKRITPIPGKIHALPLTLSPPGFNFPFSFHTQYYFYPEHPSMVLSEKRTARG